MPQFVIFCPDISVYVTLSTCLSYIKCTFLRVKLYFDFYLFIFIQSLTLQIEMNTRNPQIDCLSCGNIPEYA